MGKGGTSSCFKIMACGKDLDGNGEEEASEGKMATDKRKWVFRRRSSKNQVLSNISISGPLSVESYNKSIPEPISNSLNEPTNALLASEKGPSFKSIEEKHPMSKVMLGSTVLHNSMASVVSEDVDAANQESAVIVIQSAARRYLAHKELIKLKSIVKLQAIIRGHLVRRLAVCTLRCVQAILKLQALIRGRVHQFSTKQMNRETKDRLNYSAKVYSSSEKFLSNAFTRKLLASTAIKRPIYISCNPSKSASAWNWLERWMSLTSADVGKPHKHAEHTKLNDREGNVAEVVTLESSIAETSDPYNSETKFPNNSLLNHFSGLNPQEPQPPLVRESIQAPAEEVLFPSLNVVDVNGASNSTYSQITLQSDTNTQTDDHNDKHAVDIEKSKRTIKRTSVELLESECSRSVVVPKRSCNPSFAAAQSKFQELSAVPSSIRSFPGKGSNVHQVSGMESKSDSILLSVEKAENLSNRINKSDVCSSDVTFSTKSEINVNETSFSHETHMQIAVSECGTEISISSTLDSPDRSEAEGGEIILEIGTLEKRHFNGNGNCEPTNVCNYTNLENTGSSISVEAPDRSLSSVVNSEVNDPCNHGCLKSEPKDLSASLEDLRIPDKETAIEVCGDTPSDPLPEKPPSVDQAEPDVNAQQENASGMQGDMLSPSLQASPISHITAPESYGTPASQVSGATASSKAHSNLTAKKLKSHIAGKRSFSTANNSGGKDSSELMQKDPKSGKRRNSLGMVKPDFFDHEPRNSNNNSLPSYMQATESAKAKLHASNSPKSSPDVHEKESLMKKRHSLPISNGKQTASPRIQRSASQVQQSSKENTKRSPNVASERKWQR